MKNQFIELLKKRRSIYHLGTDIALSQTKINKIIEEAVKYTPSAFNSQSVRVLILYEEQNKKFW